MAWFLRPQQSQVTGLHAVVIHISPATTARPQNRIGLYKEFSQQGQMTETFAVVIVVIITAKTNNKD